MAKKFDKEALFADYFQTASNVIAKFESVFEVDGVWSKVFGIDDSNRPTFSSAALEKEAKDHVRNSMAWHKLSQLYDYAVDGVIEHVADASSVVIDGGEVISYLRTEEVCPAEEWERIIWQGDGRYALDSGDDVLLQKLAFLAEVDVRTVRNAISAGELPSYKKEDLTFVDNSAARNWLSGRRGFKPTRMLDDQLSEIDDVTRPAEFGAFLSAQRKRIGLESNEKKLTVFHPSVDANALAKIETGVFTLPLDAVFPIADFYQLDRKQFLSCVMQVFYGEQLSALYEISKTA